MDEATQEMIEETYHETVEEALGRSNSKLAAHMEGVVAASMMLAAMTGTDHEEAKSEVVALNLRPLENVD